MKILLIEPGKVTRPVTINSSLDAMQRTVEGLIQAVYPFEEPVALICNEEGKLRGLPLNRFLLDEEGLAYDVIAGTFFLCASPTDSENFESLSEEQLARYQELFCDPKLFPGGAD